MNPTPLLAAATAAALLTTGCGARGQPTSPDQVAVRWLQAMAAYDGDQQWELETPAYRARRTKEQAIADRQRDKAQECPTPDASGCLFPKGVTFKATGHREEGRCRRVFVEDNEPGGTTRHGAVIVLRVGDDWRVRDWKAILPDDHLEAAAARDCGVS
jgi:hypothetical protein